MKKVLLLLMMTLLVAPAYAKHDCDCAACHDNMAKGGFVDASVTPMSIATVLKQPEDAYVTLQGFISKRIGKETYVFSDGTDSMTVEIDDKIWRGQTVSPKDKVVISGEVEHEDGMLTVDVKSLQLLQQ